jgi:hypothetical protein
MREPTTNKVFLLGIVVNSTKINDGPIKDTRHKKKKLIKTLGGSLQLINMSHHIFSILGWINLIRGLI